MSGLPSTSNPYADEEALKSQREAYDRDQEAKLKASFNNPQLPTGGSSGGEGDTGDSGRQQQQAPTVDPNYGRPGGGGPPVSFQDAYSYLGGGGGLTQGVQKGLDQQKQAGTNLFNEFMTESKAGGPTTPFGDSQKQILEQGISPERTEGQAAAAKGVVGTQYGGPQSMDPEESAGIANKLGEGRDRARSLGTGFGVAAELERTDPGTTRGERVATAKQYRESPEKKEAVEDVQESADLYYQSFRDQYDQAAKFAGEQEQRAAGYREGSQDYLQGRSGEIDDRAQREADDLNRIQGASQEAWSRYRDSGDLEALIAELPEGTASPELIEMQRSSHYQDPKNARKEWQTVINSDRFASIADMPTMTLGATYKGRQSKHISSEWLKEQAERFPELAALGLLDSKSRTWLRDHQKAMAKFSQYRRSSYDTGPTRLSPEDGWSPEAKQEMRELEQIEGLARERDDALEEKFGEGSQYEAYRPMGPMAASFGEYKGIDTHLFLDDDIRELASISNVMNEKDRERVDNIVDILNTGQAAVDKGDVFELGRVEANFDDFMDDAGREIEERMSLIGGGHAIWSDFLKQTRKTYKRIKRKKRWGVIAVIATVVLAIVTAGASLPASIAALGVTTNMVVYSQLVSAALQLAETARYSYKGPDQLGPEGVRYE